MKKLIRLAAIALTGAFAIWMAACTGNDRPVDPDPVLSVEPANVDFWADGGQADVTVSGAPWKVTVTTGADWISVTPVSGVAGEKFTVTATAAAAEREGAVTVKNTVTGRTVVVPVKQQGPDLPDPVLSVTPTALEFSAASSSKDVTANGAPWTAAVTTGADWIVITPSSGVAGETFKVTVSEGTAERNGVVTVTNTVTNETVDVSVKQFAPLSEHDPALYIAGKNAAGKPVIWVNGVETVLEGGQDAISIDVYQGDIYVAGKMLDEQWAPKAVLWRNGERQILSTNNSQANSVCVSGGRVYVAGHEFNLTTYVNNATIWVDGQATTLSTENSSAKAVYVSGSDVYVAGEEQGRAALWVNGTLQSITDGVCAYSVCVSGGDVYVAGSVKNETQESDNKAELWKNGIALNLQSIASAQEPVRNGLGNSIAVSGGDVYVAGREMYYNSMQLRAVLWTNGTPQILDNGISQANSVCVFGDDVYVVGYVGSPSKATLWKNGNVEWQIEASGSTDALYVLYK